MNGGVEGMRTDSEVFVEAGRAFLACILGYSDFARWSHLKFKMGFPTESAFMKWLLLVGEKEANRCSQQRHDDPHRGVSTPQETHIPSNHHTSSPARPYLQKPSNSLPADNALPFSNNPSDTSKMRTPDVETLTLHTSEMPHTQHHKTHDQVSNKHVARQTIAMALPLNSSILSQSVSDPIFSTKIAADASSPKNNLKANTPPPLQLVETVYNNFVQNVSNLKAEVVDLSSEEEVEFEGLGKRPFEEQELAVDGANGEPARKYMSHNVSSPSTSIASPVNIENNHPVNQRNFVKYPCPLCDLLCWSLTHLASHVCRHTGEKPIACPYCPMTYRQTSVLRNHLKTSHMGREVLSNEDLRAIMLNAGKQLRDFVNLFYKKNNPSSRPPQHAATMHSSDETSDDLADCPLGENVLNGGIANSTSSPSLQAAPIIQTTQTSINTPPLS